MNSSGTRCWTSTSGGTPGFELISRPLSPETLATALRPLVSGRPDSAFLLARLASSDQEGVCAALRAAQGLGAKSRIALAVDLATVERLEANLPVTDNVGLVLDGVTARTPLSAFILDSIEAVRFDSAFITAASRNLRLDATLRAMLSLATDLALGTLASGEIPTSYLSSRLPAFDYFVQESGASLDFKSLTAEHRAKSTVATVAVHRTDRRH